MFIIGISEEMLKIHDSNYNVTSDVHIRDPIIKLRMLDKLAKEARESS